MAGSVAVGRGRFGGVVVAAVTAAVVLAIPQSRSVAVVTAPVGPPRVQVELGALERAALPLPVLPPPPSAAPSAAAPSAAAPSAAAPSAAAPDAAPLPVPPAVPAVLDGGIPVRVLAGYRHAAVLEAAADPGCGMDWALLAGIGRIESGHASGGRVDAAGTTRGRILGPVLDGSLPGSLVVLDTDGGALDGDVRFDRAIGPMQFLPSTWRSVGADGNGDGVADPNNVDDAALGAARYLCAGGGDLRTVAGATAALFRYNRSAAYGADVLAWAEAYRTGATAVPDGDGPVPAADPGPQVLAAAEGSPVPPAPAPAARPPSTRTVLAQTVPAPVPPVPGPAAPLLPPSSPPSGALPEIPTSPARPTPGQLSSARTTSNAPSSGATTTPTNTASSTPPPATTPPATTPPATTPPATTPPVTTAPATTAAVTKAPVTKAPVATAPVTTAPVTAAPVTTAPVTTAPATTSAAPIAPACPAATTLAASTTRALPDSSGLLIRFALPTLPTGCGVATATLQWDPGPAATLTVLRPTAAWSATTTAEPASAGPAVVSAPAAGTRRITVTALVAALYAGPDNGLLVRGAGVPVGPVRLTVTFVA